MLYCNHGVRLSASRVRSIACVQEICTRLEGSRGHTTPCDEPKGRKGARERLRVVTWVGCGEGNCTGWVYNSGFHNVCGHVHLACSFARACRVVIVGPLAREL